MEHKSRHNLGRYLIAVLLFLCTSVFAHKILLTPSRSSLVRQNLCIDQMRLQRFHNEDEVQDAVRRGSLLALPITQGLHVAPSLPLSRRYARPIAIQFLLTLSEVYRLQFGKPLTIDSAVRDANTQRRLRRINKSAAPVYGETASSHETGATIDLSKKLTGAQLRWLRNMLSYEVAMNRAVVEEERHCLHIEVIGEIE